MYKPSKPFITPLQILHVETKKINGVVTKAYTDGEVINGSFATYGGTETAVNGVYSIIDIATIETYYTDKIKSDDRIRRLTDGAVFEIKGEPENIEMRFLFLKIKVQRVKGGA